MLSVSKISSSDSIYEEGCYYDENNQFKNWYLGKFAKELDFIDIPTEGAEGFKKLFDGATGFAAGVKIGGKDRDAGRDLCFSPPKSISIIALIGNDGQAISIKRSALGFMTYLFMV